MRDACNTAEDADNDEWSDALDNCVNVANTDQFDEDGDDVGNICDNCPIDANLDQLDTSSNGDGDVCNDADDDNLRDSIEDNGGVLASLSQTGPDPAVADTDGDGLSDGLQTLE